MLNTVMPAPVTQSVSLPVVIKTRRAVLRKVEHADAPALSAKISDYDIAKMTGTIPFPMPLLSAEIWISLNRAAFDMGSRFNYALCPDDTGELSGIIGFFKTRNDGWELGYWVARELWGQGYASESCAAAMQAFQDVNGPAAFEAGVFKDNPASMRVLEKLGFTRNGEDNDAAFSMARMCKTPGWKYRREPDYDT